MRARWSDAWRAACKTDRAVAIAAEFTKNSIKQTALDRTEARYGLNSESQMLGFLQALDQAVREG